MSATSPDDVKTRGQRQVVICLFHGEEALTKVKGDGLRGVVGCVAQAADVVIVLADGEEVGICGRAEQLQALPLGYQKFEVR